ERGGIGGGVGGGLGVLARPAAQLALGKDHLVDQVDLVLRPGVAPATVQARLAAVLPPTLSVEPPLQRGALYEGILASFQAMIAALSLLCLVAGGYIVYNTPPPGAAPPAPPPPAPPPHRPPPAP